MINRLVMLCIAWSFVATLPVFSKKHYVIVLYLK